MSSTSKHGVKRQKRSRSLLPEEEAARRVNVYGEEVTLNKGPWIKEEDDILKAHIIKHGVGNWNAVQKESGLLRCGKSCRLRWYNHLRPGVKKGSFTAEEEHKILDFYFRNGSKWAQMAALLPGRTDNEIKNFWHTRYKKRQRHGLPIFPDEIISKYSLNGSQENADTLANEFSQHHETETFNVDITNLNLTHFKFRPDMLPQYFDSQYDKPNSDLVGRCSDMSDNTLSMPSAVVGQRYLFSSRSAAVPEVFDQYGQYPMLSTPCDPNLNTNLLHGYDNPVTGIHAASNISSEPINGSMRFESPSFQNLQTQQCNWSPLPSFESVDKFVQSPPIETYLSVRDYPDCSRLIDPIVNFNYPMLSTPCDPILDTNLLYGFEPPSFQNLQQQQCSLSPLPSFGYVDEMVQSPPIEYVDKMVQSPPIEYVDKMFQSPPIEYVDKMFQSPPIEYVDKMFQSPPIEYVDKMVQSPPIEYVDKMFQSPPVESVDRMVQSPPIESYLSLPDSRLTNLIEYCNSDQNLKRSSIDSLQANTDSMTPYEADNSTQWNGLDYDQHDAIVNCQLNFLRRVRQRCYNNRGAFNDQLPAYYTSNKQDN